MAKEMVRKMANENTVNSTDFYNGVDLTRYDKNADKEPIWNTRGICYHESVLFYDTTDTDPALLANGGNTRKSARLLYPIDRIVSVRNRELNICYLEGVDYEVKAGELVWLETGSMPIFRGEFRSLKKEENKVNDSTVTSGGKGSFAQYYATDNDEEGYGLTLYFDTISKYTVYVTYTHSRTWEGASELKAPTPQGERLKKLYDKLEVDGAKINVLVFGDSTATGAAASGMGIKYDLFTKKKENGEIELLRGKTPEGGYSIKAPTFFERATERLVEESGKSHEIAYYNLAIGGVYSGYGLEVLGDRIDFMKKYYSGEDVTPDVVYIKFMANEVNSSPDRYYNNIKGITEIIRANFPDASIVFVTGKINNISCLTYKNNVKNCLDMEAALEKLAGETENSVIAKNTSMFFDIVKVKQVEDYLTNNINHAHDYWSMVTGQVIAASMAKNK